MKKTIIISLITLVLIAFSGMAMAYTPPPGVLSPDEVDFEGETVTIYGVNLEEGSWIYDTFNDILLDRVAEAEELFNVKIEAEPSISNQQISNRVLSGDSVRDIIARPHRDINYYNLVSSNMLYPVGSILPDDYFENLSNIDKQVANKLAYNDEYYTFGSKNGNVNESMFFVQYNKTLLENEDQPDPYELYLDGEWDYDAFEEIAKAVTKDTNGDGETDQWGASAISGEGIFRFLQSNGVETARVDENGEYVFDLTSKAAINALNIVEEWSNEDKILSSGSDTFEDGTIAFALMSSITWWRHAKDNMDDEYGVIPLPMGPDVDRYHYPTFNFVQAVIPANADNPEGLIAIYEFLFRKDDVSFDEHINALIDLSISSREQLDAYMTGIENWQGEGDPFQWSGLWDIVQESLSEAVAGERGAASAMEEIEPEAQAYLDDLFKQ